MPHWKKLINPDYLGAYSLEVDGEYRNKIVTIESIQKEMVTGSGGKQEECVTATIKGEKPIILNRTNLKAIESVAGSPDTDRWKGLKIELTVKRVKAFGDITDALRVLPEKPKKPILHDKHEKWDLAVKALKDGTTTIQAILKIYEMSETMKDKLLNQSFENE